jgi:hypothetical protein
MSQHIPIEGKDDADESRPSGWANYLLWLVTFAAAIVVERLTKSVALAAIMPCYHASWKTLHCAFWLKRSDPISSRGWACFFFYAATACWKAAAAALATAWLCYQAAEWLNQPQPEHFISTLLTILAICGSLMGILGNIGAISAWRGKIQVWVTPSVYYGSHGNFQLLGYLHHSYIHFNQAWIVLATAIILVPMCIGLSILFIGSLWNNNPNALIPENGLSCVGFIIALIGTPIISRILIPFFSRRIIAKSPAQCWPPEPIDENLA